MISDLWSGFLCFHIKAIVMVIKAIVMISVKCDKCEVWGGNIFVISRNCCNLQAYDCCGECTCKCTRNTPLWQSILYSAGNVLANTQQSKSNSDMTHCDHFREPRWNLAKRSHFRRIASICKQIAAAAGKALENIKMLCGKSREVGMWQMALWDCTLKWIKGW